MKLNPFSKSVDKMCLVCDEPAGKSPSEIRYKYKDGEATAYLCKICGDDIENDDLDKETDDDLAI
jgi:hypothetical protein|tara:strand:+ start:1447 stop:1641 length:195 start_codon:yes stop_codon:yes gene_type:complete